MNILEYKAEKPFAQSHLLTLQDYTADEIMQVLSLAAKLKKMRKDGDYSYQPLHKKKMAMIFTKPSMRTRVSFEVGCTELGGYAFMLSKEELGLGERESVADVARVLSRYCDGIMIRTFAQDDVAGLAQHGSIPIINGLTDDFHPCQALTDMLTLYEHKGDLKGIKLAFVGDGNNVAASLMIIASKLGMDMVVACPQGYEPPAVIMAYVQACAQKSGATITVEHDPMVALAGADAVYTDIWASMGQEGEAAEKNATFRPYQVDDKLMAAAKPDAIFMHCLPAHRGDEVTDGVMESAASVVFDQAENRLHAQKAVMALLMGKGALPA